MRSDWTKYTFNEVCTRIFSGGTPSTKQRDYWNGDINWLSSGETGNRYIYKTDRKITELGIKKSSTQLAHKGDIIIASAGQGYTRGQASYLMIDTYVNQSVIVFKTNPDIINSRFFFFNLSSRYEELRQLSDGTSTRGGLSGWIVKRMEINLPPLSEQKQIVAILSAIDDKIELNTAINKNLEEQAFSLFDISFPNVVNGNKTIGDKITPKRGKSLLSKNAIVGDVPVVAGGLAPSTYHNVSNTQAPVVTISASGANAGFINLWNMPVWASDSSFIDNSVTSNVFFWYVMLKKRQKEIFATQTGSAQPHIYPKHIAEMPMTDISEKQIKDYEQQVTSIFELIGANKAENKRLSEIRDTLLPKLMNGEIDISAVKV